MVMKKIFLFLLTILMAFGIVVTGFASNAQHTEEVKIVLNREIFFVKNQAPQLYTSAVNGIDRTAAYVENWKFYNILNDETFRDATWTSFKEGNDVHVVRFTGSPRISPPNTSMSVLFFVKRGAKSPIAIDLVTKDSKGVSEINKDKFVARGVDSSMAIFNTDVAISVMLAACSEHAFRKVR